MAAYTLLQSGLGPRRQHLLLYILGCIVLASICAITFHPFPFKPAIPFEIDSALWGDGGPSAVAIVPTFPPGPPPKKWGMKVTDVVHYIMFAKPDGSSVLDYRQYLAIRSALLVQQPAAIYFHYDILPSGVWWDQLEPFLTLHQVIAPSKVWDQPIELAAHKSDILRMYALKSMGGVYLDMDVFVLRSLDELFYEPFTMALEEKDFYKMGNAVIVSAPNAPFLDHWLVGYQDFRDYHYEYNGVIKPMEIARAHPEDVRLLNDTAFFYPQWWMNDIVFTTTDFDWDTHPGYTYHAWGSLHSHLRNLNPQIILDQDTSFHRLMRRYMGESDLDIWLQSQPAVQSP